MAARAHARWEWMLLAGVLAAVLTSRVRDVASDPRVTLVSGQMLLTHGSFALDPLGAGAVRDFGTVVQRVNGQAYNAFPLGSSILALPVIAVATALGVPLAPYANERAAQVVTAAVVALVTAWLLVRLARLYLPPAFAFVVAGFGWFGTSFASTGATALWSHDCATVLALAVVYAAVSAKQAGRAPAGFWIGAALFFAYLCRPTFSIFAPCLLFYVFCYARRQAFAAALVLAAGLVLFALWSEVALGTPLPRYYLPQRLAGSSYVTALATNLISPSRGLFLFSPLFLLPLLHPRDTKVGLDSDRPVVAIAVIWPVAHLLLVSRLRHYWAGYSYGPRFMFDVLPGLFLLLCLTLRSALARSSPVVRPLLYALGALSVVFNTVQGLYNPAVKRWNAEPSIDQHPELVFDWRYPQFLHTRSRQAARRAEWGIAAEATPLVGPAAVGTAHD